MRRKSGNGARASTIISARQGFFFNSQSPSEKRHLINAFRFELGMVGVPAIRARMVSILSQVDKDLASAVAEGLGFPVSPPAKPINQSFGADTNPKSVQPTKVVPRSKHRKR